MVIRDLRTKISQSPDLARTEFSLEKLWLGPNDSQNAGCCMSLTDRNCSRRSLRILILVRRTLMVVRMTHEVGLFYECTCNLTFNPQAFTPILSLKILNHRYDSYLSNISYSAFMNVHHLNLRNHAAWIIPLQQITLLPIHSFWSTWVCRWNF